MQRRWELCCTVLMVLALACTLFGALGFVDARGGGRGMGDVLQVLIWGFGILGLSLCCLEKAVGRKLLAILGFGTSIIALLYSMQMYQCPFNEWCDKSTDGYGWCLTVAIAAAGLLLLHDKHREQLAPGTRIAIRVVSLPLLLAWIAAIVLAAVLFSKPIAVRVAPPAPAVPSLRDAAALDASTGAGKVMTAAPVCRSMRRSGRGVLPAA